MKSLLVKVNIHIIAANENELRNRRRNIPNRFLINILSEEEVEVMALDQVE